jgi:hypothetical protein
MKGDIRSVTCGAGRGTELNFVMNVAISDREYSLISHQSFKYAL